jgi:hypothetical protein
VYSDTCEIFTAYQPISKSRNDIVVELTDAEWIDYQRVELEYCNWQNKLEAMEKVARNTKQDVKLKVEAKVA